MRMMERRNHDDRSQPNEKHGTALEYRKNIAVKNAISDMPFLVA